MRILWTVFFSLFLLSEAVQATPQSLSDHEKVAATLSFSEAYEIQKKLTLEYEIYSVVPYSKRTYTLIKKQVKQDARYLQNYSILSMEYGNALAKAGKNEMAGEILHESLKVHEKLYGENGPELIDPLMSLGNNSQTYRSKKMNNAYYDRALEIARDQYGDNSAIVGKLYFEISQSSLVNSSRDVRRALTKMRKAHRTLTEKLGTEHPDTALSSYRMGEVAIARRKYKDAAQFLENAASVYDNIAPNDRITQRMHELLVKTYENSDKSDLATKHCQMVGKIKEANGDANRDGLSYIPIHRAQPQYPRAAYRRGGEGQVVVELTVAIDGTAKDIIVLESRGHSSFKKASIDAAQKFRYAPRYENGSPVDTRGVQYKFTFQLAN